MSESHDKDSFSSSAGVRFIPNAPELDDDFWLALKERTIAKSSKWRFAVVMGLSGLLTYLVGLEDPKLAVAMGILGAWLSNGLLKRQVRRSLKAHLLSLGLAEGDATFVSNADAEAQGAYQGLEESIAEMQQVFKKKRVKWFMRVSSTLGSLARSSASGLGLSFVPIFCALLAKGHDIIGAFLFSLLGAAMVLGFFSIPVLILGMGLYATGAIPLGRDVGKVERFWGRCKALFQGDYFGAEKAFFEALERTPLLLGEGDEQAIDAPLGSETHVDETMR